MRDHRVRHDPAGAQRGCELRQGRSRHEQEADAGVLPLPHAHVHKRDANAELAEAAEQGRAGEESLHARSIQSFSTQLFYFTAYSHHKEEPPLPDTLSSDYQRSRIPRKLRPFHTPTHGADPDKKFRNSSGIPPCNRCAAVRESIP